MADRKITELTALAASAIDAADQIPVADISDLESKKVGVVALVQYIVGALLSNGTIPLSKLVQDSGTFDGARLLNGSVAEGAIANDAITGGKIADNVVSKGDVSEPVADFIGQFWAHPSTGVLKRWTGSTWQIVGSTAQAVSFSVTAALPLVGSFANNELTLGHQSQTSYTVFAAPAGSNGAPGFRLLTASDLPELGTAKITSGTFDAARIPDLDAAKITTGTFGAGRIPNLDASKITTGTIDAARLPVVPGGSVTGVLDVSNIPSLPASKITSGVFDVSQIPTFSTAQIASGTFGAARIADDSLTAAKFADNSVTIVDTDTPSSGAFTGQRWINPQTGQPSYWNGSAWIAEGLVATGVEPTTQATSFTLALANANDLISTTAAGAINVTVPPNADVAFPTGTQILIQQDGTGQFTIVPGSGVTLKSSGGRLKSAAQHAVVSLVKTGTNTWVVAGERSA